MKFLFFLFTCTPWQLAKNSLHLKVFKEHREKKWKNRTFPLNRRGMNWLRVNTIILLIFISSYTLAYNAQSTKIDSVLQSLLDYLTSTPARIIAVLAIVGVGYATLHLGRLPKQRAISIVIGIGIIFGGAALFKILGLGDS